MILHQIISKLQLCKKEDQMDFKIIAYIDQVYLNQKKEFINFINDNADFGMLFTKYWEDCIIEQGLKLPHDYLPHGFNPNIYYPIPKRLVRLHYGISPDDFVILNLNRNQPRKRWDICLKAFAEIVSRYPQEPIKLLIGTATQGAWNLIELFERELKKRNCTLEQGMKHVIILDRPQKVSDEETNILYNVADIGINTCDGEGFGLCNFEQAAIGIPQIVSKLGGFLDFFDEKNSIMPEPKMAYYVDHSRDMVAGEALLCNYIDFVEAIETYYFNKEIREKHSKAARSKILTDYKWQNIADKLHSIIYRVLNKPVPNSINLLEEVEKIDNLQSKAEVQAPPPISKLKKKKQKEIEKLKKKLEKLETK
jgi:glycosyltransferase involved in cell wall biosynthesis